MATCLHLNDYGTRIWQVWAKRLFNPHIIHPVLVAIIKCWFPRKKLQHWFTGTLLEFHIIPYFFNHIIHHQFSIRTDFSSGVFIFEHFSSQNFVCFLFSNCIKRKTKQNDYARHHSLEWTRMFLVVLIENSDLISGSRQKIVPWDRGRDQILSINRELGRVQVEISNSCQCPDTKLSPA